MTGIEEQLQGEGPWTLADAWTYLWSQVAKGDLGTLFKHPGGAQPLRDVIDNVTLQYQIHSPAPSLYLLNICFLLEFYLTPLRYDILYLYNIFIYRKQMQGNDPLRGSSSQ